MRKLVTFFCLREVGVETKTRVRHAKGLVPFRDGSEAYPEERRCPAFSSNWLELKAGHTPTLDLFKHSE